MKGNSLFKQFLHNSNLMNDILDDNECQDNSHFCHPNAVCTNTKGAYNCTCRNGYKGDGYNCTGKMAFLHWLMDFKGDISFRFYQNL